MSKCYRTGTALCLVFLLGGGLVGCSEKDGDKPKVYTREGTAKLVDIENRTVSMTVLNKKGEEIEMVGTFTDQTEVEINGRARNIRDIRPNDKVKVFAKRETINGVEKLVAEKVIVTRPQGSDWVSTTQPSDEAPREPKPTGN